jgi:hypothetical protein
VLPRYNEVFSRAGNIHTDPPIEFLSHPDECLWRQVAYSTSYTCLLVIYGTGGGSSPLADIDEFLVVFEAAQDEDDAHRRETGAGQL